MLLIMLLIMLFAIPEAKASRSVCDLSVLGEDHVCVRDNRRIMVVDDSQVTRRLMKRCLKALHRTTPVIIHEAESGEAALMLHAKSKYIPR